MRLEVGDRIVCTSDTSVYEGLRGTVIQRDRPNAWCCVVRWDKNIKAHFRECGYAGYEELRAGSDYDYMSSMGVLEVISPLEQLADCAE